MQKSGTQINNHQPQKKQHGLKPILRSLQALKPETMLKLAYALHKLCVKHATRRAIHLEDSVAATQINYRRSG
jgi:hypothetical protein